MTACPRASCVSSSPLHTSIISCSEQYNLEYYLDFTRKLTELGIHVLAIKDMAGLLKPAAATTLVRRARKRDQRVLLPGAPDFPLAFS